MTTLFDLAGATDAAALAARWPVDRVRWEHGDYDEAGAASVDRAPAGGASSFRNVVSAVAPTSPSPAAQATEAAVSISADLHVNLAKPGRGAARRRPPAAVRLLPAARHDRRSRRDSPGRASRMAQSELVVCELPVQIEPPVDLLSSAGEDPLDVPFDNAHPDSLGMHVEPLDAGVGTTWLKCFVTLRVTRHGEVLIQPTVPISLGRCIFMGLPCRAVHDIALYPDVLLQAPAHVRELPIGWAAREDKRSILAERVGADQRARHRPDDRARPQRACGPHASTTSSTPTIA